MAPAASSSSAVRSIARSSTDRAASRIAFAIPSGPELPCATTATPRRPSRIAPPVASGSSSRRRPPSAGRKSRPPRAATGFDRAASPTARANRLRGSLERLQRDVAGEPVGDDDVGRVAQQVAALDVADEFDPVAAPASAACASTTIAVPFFASSPTESSATRGESTPSTALANAAPSTPNCTRSWLRTSVLAPTSSSSGGGPERPGTGSWTVRAGRRTPRRRLQREQRRRHRRAGRPGADQGLRAALGDVARPPAPPRPARASARRRRAPRRCAISSGAATTSSPSRPRTLAGSPNTRSDDAVGERGAQALDQDGGAALDAPAVDGDRYANGAYSVGAVGPPSSSATSGAMTSRPA